MYKLVQSGTDRYTVRYRLEVVATRLSGQLVTCQLVAPLSPVSVAQSNASERSIVVTAT